MPPLRPVVLLAVLGACSSGGSALPPADAGSEGGAGATSDALDALSDVAAESAPEAGGPSWTHLGLDNDAFYVLAVDPKDPSIVFAASANDGVFRTKDAGKTWLAIDTGLPSAKVSVTALAIDPMTPQNVYAGVGSSGLYRSTDGGDTWTPSPTAMIATPASIVVDSGTPANLFAVGAAEGIYASTDHGVSWTKAASMGLPLGSLDFLALDAKTGKLFCGASMGILFASSDEGAHFTPAATGLMADANGMILTFVAVPAGALFVETLGDGLWTSPDTGATWSLALANTAEPALAFDPSDPTTLYVSAAMGAGLFRSIDGGATFLAGGPPLQPIISRVAVAPDGTVYVAAGSGEGVWSRPASPIWP